MAEKRTTIMLNDDDQKYLAIAKRKLAKTYGSTPSVTWIIRMALRALVDSK